MAWTWRYEDGSGTEVSPATAPAGEPFPTQSDTAPAGEPFPTQSDAETWLGENWRELLSAGVEQVSLLEAGRQVYGPMSLKPAD